MVVQFGTDGTGRGRPDETRRSGKRLAAWRVVALGLCAVFAVVAAVGPASRALAQNFQQINPGGIESEQRRQLERLERQQQQPRQQGPAVIGPDRRAPGPLVPGGPKFPLKKLTFDDSKFLTPEELDEIAKAYVGRNVDFAELQKLLAAINELYAKKGIVTGIATLPPQQVTGGVVHIKLTEGRLGKTTVAGQVQTSEDYVRQRVPVTPGDVIDVHHVSRQVTWFNRTNDVQIRALLQPGTTFGLTDIQFAVTEAPVNVLQVFFRQPGRSDHRTL